MSSRFLCRFKGAPPLAALLGLAAEHGRRAEIICTKANLIMDTSPYKRRMARMRRALTDALRWIGPVEFNLRVDADDEGVNLDLDADLNNLKIESPDSHDTD